MMSASGGDGLGGQGAGVGAGGKSDTSSRAGPVPFKNPLLSMQVTGLTLDDFAHNAMLLPAAPPPMLEVSREPETTDIKKPLVFSSVPPELQDPDSFSEIDLHSTAEPANTTPSTSTTIEYNPLQDLDLDPTADGSTNGGGSFVQQTSSITAQFAAQLPNVASTVFSTFSRVIKGTSPGPQPPQQPQHYVPQPPEPVVQAAYDYSQQPQDLGGYPEAPPVAPTFFNPVTVGPAVPPPAAVPVGGSNTYRLGGVKKKTYAHIPGLSSAGPVPTVKAPEQVPIPEVTGSQSEVQHPAAKSGLSFFEKIPNLLEKIPKPVGFSVAPQPEVAAPSPIDYFGGQQAQSSFGQSLPPVVQPSYGPPEVPPLNQPRPPSGEPETLPPPPTFFSPAQVASVPNLPQNQPSKNPYSSSRLSRGVGLYKNPLAPPPPVAAPSFLPNQEPPRNFFQPPPPEHPSQQQHPPTPDTSLSNSRPHSSLSSSQLFAAVPFEPAPDPPETKTVLDSRSKSTENVLSPPPRPNSNLSEPALFIESRPLSVFKPEPAPEVNFFNPTTFNQPPAQPVQVAALPPPPTTGSLGSNPYNLQKTRKPAYAVPPSLASAQPVNFFQPAANFFNPPAAAPVALFNPAPVEPVLQAPPPAVFFNPKPEPPVSLFNPVPVEPVVQTAPPAAFFNPINVPAPAPTQSPVTNDINDNSNLITPIPLKTQDINANPANLFATSPPPTSQQQLNDINANFFNLQLAPPAQTPPSNPVDFFNGPDQPAATGQAQSQSVGLFSFFGQPERPTHPPPPPQAAPVPSAVNFFGQQEEEAGTDESDGQQVPIIEPEEGEEEEEVIGADERNPVGGEPGGNNAVNDSQLDDRYDDPSEQERIGNAPEPIFSSDNLFEFKRSAFEDDTYSKDVLIDANSSSMAAMTATAAGGAGGPVAAANAAADTSMASIHETPSSTAATNTNVAYRPIYRHWFFRREIEGKSLWTPFSMTDSLALEDALPLASVEGGEQEQEEVIVHVDGGRHDVSVRERKMAPVYWKGATQDVRRCSWFYKNVDSRFVPYEEEVAELLEREYKEAATSGEWHRRVVLPNGETVVFHGASVIVHFLQTQNPDTWGGSSPVPATTNRPRVVKRGVDEFNIEDGEPERIDHLLFMVHGIGEACDLRFRPVEEVVDEFRSISAQLVQSHYRSSFDRGDIGRVEILPISWHNDLHSEESGIDKKLKAITLDSIPKLRNFTNDTVLDVLFYTSPVFCQNIIDAVGKSLNRLYTLFLQRNPDFGGGVSLAGHSLGSLILFDLLCHQKAQPMETENSENPDGDKVSALHSIHPNHRPLSRKCSQQINYEVGPAGTGQPYITYPQLLFNPKKFFALGSPIGMFVTVRGIDTLGLDFKLPTCDGFFNIFHPYDPVAYRIEALVNPELSQLRPVLIPHHKGRKRMHLELKETMLRVGTDLKQKVLDTFRNTMDAVYSITQLNRPDPKAIEHEVDKVIEDQLKFETGSSTVSSTADLDTGETDLPLGKLNGSRRVDYVLQEAPLEFFNEYIFALTSHVCYWESEDTMLFLMKEIYSSLGVQSDSQIPQQSMTIERPIVSPTPSTSSQSNYNLFPQQHQRPTSPGCSNR